MTFYDLQSGDVLILVLMEYGLRLFLGYDQVQGGSRLNPCFNGIWSATLNLLSEMCSLSS